MKRTAAAFMFLAGLGGCMSTDKTSEKPMAGRGSSATPVQATGYVGPNGEPITKRGQEPGVMRADGRNIPKGGLRTVGTGDHPDKVGHEARGNWVPTGTDGVPGYFPGRGILPVPAMGPYGAVAAVGALPPGGLTAPINARTSVRFGEPHDMRISWYGADGKSDTVLTTPARYNFAQGGIYRLKLSNIGRGGTDLYPTLEVVPATPKTATFLAHSSVPVSFTDEDFEQVTAGNFLTKVVYLPDPQFQDIAAVAGPAEVISTKLEPGIDPVAEARKRGEILLIIRIGNVDLEAKGTPALDAPNPYAVQPRFIPAPIPGGPAGPGGPGGISDMGPGPISTGPGLRPMPTKLPE